MWRYRTRTPSVQAECKKLHPSPSPRFLAPNEIVNDKLYIFGGFYSNELQVTNRVDEYDLKEDRWRRLADLPIAVTHSGLAIDGQDIWLAGGFVGNQPGKVVTDVWIYNIKNNKWRRGIDLPEKRGGGALVRIGRELHYFGGLKEDRKTDSAQHWTLSLRNPIEWKDAPPFPEARNHFGAAVLNGKIYAIGGAHGHDEGYVDLDWVHTYDPKTGKWEQIASLDYGRSHFETSTFVFEKKIFIAGGRRGDIPTVYDIDAYDPERNEWLSMPALPEALQGPMVKIFDDQLIVINGGILRGWYPSATVRTCRL